MNIDYTVLKPDATLEDIFKACDTAVDLCYRTICVNPCYVRNIKQRYPRLPITSVLDFPFGAGINRSAHLVNVIEAGATEVDVVMKLGLFKAGLYKEVIEDFTVLAKIAHTHKAVIKIIVEACLWDEEQLKLLIKMCEEANVDYIKTSTGTHEFDTRLPLVERNLKLTEWVKLFNKERETHGYKIKIKASGGISNKLYAESLTKDGADRIGTSSVL